MLAEILLHPLIRYFAGPGLMALGALLQPPASFVLVVFGWLLVAGSSWSAGIALHREDARQAIDSLLDIAVTSFEAAGAQPDGRTLRANIMVVTEDEGALEMAFWTSGYLEGERDLLWQPGEGCVGLAWERQEVVLAPEDVELPVQASDAELATRPWNMTPEQIRMTAETIAAVLSVPIFGVSRPSHVLGVLSIDDERALDDSPLGSSDVQSAAEQLAVAVAPLLEKAGYAGR